MNMFKTHILGVLIFMLTMAAPVFAQEDEGIKPMEPSKKVLDAADKSGVVMDPRDKRALIYYNTAGELAGTGDPKKSGSPSVFQRMGEGWHPTALADENLPVDKYGLVNWVKLQTEGWIDPKWTLEDNADPEEEMMIDVDVLFVAKSKYTNDVIYPHDIHTWWLKCDICHDSVGGPIFEPLAGGNNVLMVKMEAGQWCGRCHNRVAFPLTDCKRCHVKPKGTPVDDFLIQRDLTNMTNMGY